MGERSAVRPKSGKSVSQSDPGLRRPTPPSTAGRKPAARPPIHFLPAKDSIHALPSREAGDTQRKTGRGPGQSPAIQCQREALASFIPSGESDLALPDTLDDSDIQALIQFFQILDLWKREADEVQPM